MFPADGFQFVFCGLATLAASVGYACARNLSPSFLYNSAYTAEKRPSDLGQSSPLPRADLEKSAFSSPNNHPQAIQFLTKGRASPTEQVSTVCEPASLKRKYSGDDSLEDTGYPGNGPSDHPNKRSKTPPVSDDTDLIEAPPMGTPSLSSVIKQETHFTHHNGDLPLQTALVDSSSSLSSSPPRLHSRSGTPSAQFSVLKSKPNEGFAAFASAPLSFSRTANGDPSSPLDGKPIWQRGAEVQGHASDNPLAAEIHSKTTHTHISGEENEDVESELKGVKLYIKRGTGNFSDGMFGHVKLLLNSKANSERLLLRREPVWQVSMNIGMNPLVRCTFDEEAQALRLILKEPVEQTITSGGQRPSELVIYVIKRGRVAKDAFREFVDVMLASSHLKAKSS